MPPCYYHYYYALHQISLASPPTPDTAVALHELGEIYLRGDEVVVFGTCHAIHPYHSCGNTTLSLQVYKVSLKMSQ